MADVFSGLVALADPGLLILLVIASIGGVIIGALPGLNATTGAALPSAASGNSPRSRNPPIALSRYCKAVGLVVVLMKVLRGIDE